ncbi:MAG: class I SAM-dependent methyltransferase [Candidatus Adiutricales bacterium]
MKCRFCGHGLEHEFVDLGNSPPSNSFLTREESSRPEVFFPLKLFLCHRCFLVQIDEVKKSEEIFSREYIYYSSFSTSWVEHARRYVDMIADRFDLNNNSLVIEIASNDGYLLQHVKEKNIPCLGIEPSEGVANAARDKGIETRTEFFGRKLARELARTGQKGDLLVGNNVLAHVPDINDFVKGLKIALKENGVITLEFPHLMRLIDQTQFDTIYHEHYSYFSMQTVVKIFEHHGLAIFDVEELPTHGGSLRIYARHVEDSSKPVTKAVSNLMDRENSQGLNRPSCCRNFQTDVNKIKDDLLSFLIKQKRLGKTVAGYGAAAKGNTLLNYCGIRKDLLMFVADASPHKQGMFLPASHIPVVHEKEIKRIKPDYILILPWNIKEEIIEQLEYIQQWDGRFILPIPELEVA